MDIEAEIQRLESTLKSILEKYVPVSEQRLDKIFNAVRETVNVYAVQLAEFQEDRRLQSLAIESLQNRMAAIEQAQMVQMAMSGGRIGMPVPKE